MPMRASNHAFITEEKIGERLSAGTRKLRTLPPMTLATLGWDGPWKWKRVRWEFEGSEASKRTKNPLEVDGGTGCA